MDIYKIGDKTQVFLLEIPATAIDFFASVTSNIEEDIIKKARESFDNKINADVIPELQTEEWKDRTSFPIGMNDKGELFYQADKTNDLIQNSNAQQQNKNTPESNNQTERKAWWKFW